MHRHDWVTGLLSEIERYCVLNKFDKLTLAVSTAIAVATEEIDGLEVPENIIYLSEYMNNKILSDPEAIIQAFSQNIQEMLLKD